MKRGKFKINVHRIPQNPTQNVIVNDLSKDLLNERKVEVSCDEHSDNKTTYVQKKEWEIEKSSYNFPPYVECEYVI